MEMHSSDVVMFVRSAKVIKLVTPPDAHNEVMGAMEKAGFYTVAAGAGSWGVHATGGGTAFFDGGRFGNRPIFDQELPEDEAETVYRVFRKVREKGGRLHLVDVGKETAFRRLIEEHLKHLPRFPVLVRPDGRRLVGPEECTDAQLDKFLAD